MKLRISLKMKALCAFLPCSGLLVQRQALPGKDLLHRRASFSLSATPKLVKVGEVWPQIPALGAALATGASISETSANGGERIG